MGILRTAIQTKFVADANAALYLDLNGTRFYYCEAESDIIRPYCVFHIFDEIYDFTFVEEFEEGLIQFDYFGDTADVCDDGITDIKAMFDYAALDVSGYTPLVMQRVLVIPSEKNQPDNTWQGIVRYELLIQKN